MASPQTNRLTFDEAEVISRACYASGGPAEEWLKNKCRWEQRTRTSVIMGWGDPREIVKKESDRHA